MEVIIKEDYEAMSREAAEIVAQLVRKKPDCVLGLATGSTPIGLYKELIRMHREEGLDFSQVTTFNLDEYFGLPPSHEQSYHFFMRKHLFDHINVSKDRIFVPDGMTNSVETYCEEYEKRILKTGGIDLQVLGIGSDGHIGFNEPGSSLASRTRMKTLTEQTVRDNARFFGRIDDVPRYSLTMGVGTILETKRCLLLCSGGNKAEIITQALEGPVSAFVTASALQMHPHATFILDEPAAGKLSQYDYYKWVYENKPGY